MQKSFLKLDTTPDIKSENEINPICFRDLVPEINDTTYLTHSVYYYPAKFIPHVVRYCIRKYTRETDTIIDPFAGSGTMGLEAYLCERNAFLLDLNLLLNHIMPIKIPTSKDRLDKMALYKFLNEVTNSAVEFTPSWSNCEYWYPREILHVLKRYWGYIKFAEQGLYTRIAEAALVKVSKHFSYAEHRVPKLFTSKRKKQYIEDILQTNWHEKLDEKFFNRAYKILDDINRLNAVTAHHSSTVTYYGGVDSASFSFGNGIEFDALITSPPYMQAQEYIRTSKMDLYWLGYNDHDIRKLSALEIPYRKPNKIIRTETLNMVRGEIPRADLRRILNSYFCYVIQALENAMARLQPGAKACIFIGNPRIDGIKVEIWRIFKEYFGERNFDFEAVYEDKIKTRQLFGKRKNKNPDGMKSEFLLVLTKNG